MGRPRILDQRLMEKIAAKTGKTARSGAINSMVSRKASRLQISPEAAQVILAKELGIGTATFYRRLDAIKQDEVRDASPTLILRPDGDNRKRSAKGSRRTGVAPKIRTRLLLDYLIQDSVLKARCADILVGKADFDRAINHATQVLEDRIRRRVIPPGKLSGEALVSYAFNENPAKSRVLVASGDRDDQRGFTQILRGMVPAFRNKTHHQIIDVSREEAMCVCGFIDVLLRVIDTSERQKNEE